MGIFARFEYANEAALKATVDYDFLQNQPDLPIKGWLPRFETLAEFGRATSYEKFIAYFHEPEAVRMVEALRDSAKPDINMNSNARLYFSVDQRKFYELYCLEFVLGQGKFNAIKVWLKKLSNNLKPTDEDYEAKFLGYSPLDGGVTDVSNIMDDFRNKRGKFAEADDREESKMEEKEEKGEDEKEKSKRAKVSANPEATDGDNGTGEEEKQDSESKENDRDNIENIPANHNAHNIDFYVTFLDHILKHDKKPNSAYDWRQMSLNEYSKVCREVRDAAEQMIRALMGLM